MKSAFAATMLFLFAFGTFCFAKELPTISFNELGSDAQLIDTRSEELYIGWK